MKINIIAITGKARNGKDSVAEFLKDYLIQKGNLVTSIAYADKLKQEVCEKLNIPNVDILNYYKNNNIEWNGTNVRAALQTIADYNKLLRNNYYSDFVNGKIESVYYNLQSDGIKEMYYIITDLRMLLEEEDLRKLSRNEDFSVNIVKVKRNIKAIKESEHNSEIEVDIINEDYLIENNGSLEELSTKVINVLETISKKI